ncbi:MAG: hypothetical protein K2J30_02555 [Clostridia bacterium]|nr:hypothetical protein [Clostridia bacterium]
MKERKYIKCFFALLICSLMLFVSACTPRLKPLTGGTFVWEKLSEMEEMPFSNMKLVFSEIDEETFHEAEGVNVICDEASLAEQKYYSFDLYVFLEDENEFFQIDVVDLKKEETKWWYCGVTADSAKSYGIVSIKFWVVSNYPTQYSWLAVTIRMEVDESEKPIDEPFEFNNYRDYDYDLEQYAYSSTEGTYLWAELLEMERVPFQNVKLVLTEIDKKTFDEAEGVNVICDVASPRRLKYFSFELYVFIEEENDFFKIDIVNFEKYPGMRFYRCKTLDSLNAYGVVDLDCSFRSHNILMGISVKTVDDTTEKPSYARYDYRLKLIENQGENHEEAV